MNSCTDCTKLAPFGGGDDACKKTKPKISDVRLTCCDFILETIAPSVDSICPVGFIDDVISLDPIGDPTPFVAVEIYNKDDADETNTYAFDRPSDTGTDTWAITLGLKVLNPGNQCMLDSLKGQDVCIYYKIDGKTDNFSWRRVKGKLTAVDGGLLAGYLVTFDNIDPAEQDKPLFVNFSTADATTTALDALTQF